MKRISLTTLLGLLIAMVVGGLLIKVNAHNPAVTEQGKIHLYIGYCLVLLFATIVLLRQVTLERRKISKLDSEKHFTEIQLQEEKNRFEILFSQTNNCIALIGIDGLFVRVNKPLCELMGYTEHELLKMNYFYLINQADLNILQISIHELLENKISEHESEHECFKKNGEIIWIKSSLSLMRDYNGKADYYICQMQNITMQKKAEERLHHMAYHDALTGLSNRHKLEQFITHLLAVARRSQQCFALLFLDLDGFKNINDTIGHDAGDMLLQIVAERLRNAVRTTDMVARLGGDEFVLLITDVKKSEDVAVIANKILENVLQAIVIKSHEIYITTSIGISIYPDDGDNLQPLMKNADLALYRAKEQGKNNYQFYTQEMTGKAQEKLALKNALGHAITKNEFVLYYLPKMDLQTKRITGVEALLRWRNNEFKDITPDEIIALAEESGLIIPVSEWILRTACRQLKKWHDIGFTSLSMAVNCTSRQFKQSTFIDDILAVITEIGIPPILLEIEITESMIMKDPENTLRILDELRELGVKIAIDDFGTGYWSIGNLRKLSVDKIKIDKTFIKQVTIDETSADITSAIIAMVNKLGITSVAEGVETREQYDFLVNEGCREIQGYYITQPIPEDAMTQFLKHPVPVAEASANEEVTI